MSSIFLFDMMLPYGVDISIYDQEQYPNLEEKCFLQVDQSFVEPHSDFV